MKKLAFALVLIGSIIAASAPIAPASAAPCGKTDWLYTVSGESMTGWDIIDEVNQATGGNYSLAGAVRWLGQQGYKVVVVYRGCAPSGSPG